MLKMKICSRPALAIACIICSAQAQGPLGDWRTGIATNYGGAQDGMVSMVPTAIFKNINITCICTVHATDAWPSVATINLRDSYIAPGPMRDACNDGG